MARGIAAGAPGYFFNLAIDSVCPTCGANMKELSKKLEELNRFSMDSCNNFWDQMYKNDTPVEQRLTAVDKGVGAVTNAIGGLIPDFGESMSNPNDERTTAAKELVESNATAFILTNKLDMPSGVMTDIDPIELFINYFGTLTIQDTAGGTDIVRTPRTLKWENLLRNPDVGDNIIKLNKCADLVADPKCLDVSGTNDYVFKGLIASHAKALMTTSNAGCTGIFHAYKLRMSLPMCAEYEAFRNNHRFPYQKMVEAFDKPSELESVAEYIALQTAMHTAMKFHEEMARAFMDSIGPGKELPNGITNSDYEALLKIANDDFRAEIGKLKEEIDAHLKNITVMAAFGDLAKL